MHFCSTQKLGTILVSCQKRQVGFMVIPLRAKQEGEFIEIRHKKISPTHILSTLGVCDSVTLWPINPQKDPHLNNFLTY